MYLYLRGLSMSIYMKRFNYEKGQLVTVDQGDGTAELEYIDQITDNFIILNGGMRFHKSNGMAVVRANPCSLKLF